MRSSSRSSGPGASPPARCRVRLAPPRPQRESLYVVRGVLRLEFEGFDGHLDAYAGDFVHVPSFTVHRESNPTDEPSVAVIARAGGGIPTVNLEGPEGHITMTAPRRAPRGRRSSGCACSPSVAPPATATQVTRRAVPPALVAQGAARRHVDRVVFGSPEASPPGRLEWVDTSPTDGSGLPVRVAGAKILALVFHEAAAHDQSGTTVGPQSFALPNVITAVGAGDFEGAVLFGLGVQKQTTFHVSVRRTASSSTSARRSRRASATSPSWTRTWNVGTVRSTGVPARARPRRRCGRCSPGPPRRSGPRGCAWSARGPRASTG